ncbi:hypothetical protein BD414DRAFT_11909 [Trametes punicea]|nr:hypothetical protein BD414DRAFT_11909 [Trametes punicea]
MHSVRFLPAFQMIQLLAREAYVAAARCDNPLWNNPSMLFNAFLDSRPVVRAGQSTAISCRHGIWEAKARFRFGAWCGRPTLLSILVRP